MRLREVAAATGLDERTIIRLEKKGYITCSRLHGDPRGERYFDPAVVPFIRRFYKRDVFVPPPSPSPLMKVVAALDVPAAVDDRSPITQELDAVMMKINVFLSELDPQQRIIALEAINKAAKPEPESETELDFEIIKGGKDKRSGGSEEKKAIEGSEKAVVVDAQRSVNGGAA